MAGWIGKRFENHQPDQVGDALAGTFLLRGASNGHKEG
jgi:hypothetical protein